MELSLPQKIEGILFYFGEEQPVSHIAKVLGVSESEAKEAAKALAETLQSRGIKLIFQNEKLSLAVASELSDTIRALREEERQGELSKAAQEILSIVLYAGPITKASIDYIRGVNSQVSIRNLMVRGLIEKNALGKQRVEYTVTGDFLRSLGVSNVQSLERFDEIRNELLASLSVNEQEK